MTDSKIRSERKLLSQGTTPKEVGASCTAGSRPGTPKQLQSRSSALVQTTVEKMRDRFVVVPGGAPGQDHSPDLEAGSFGRPANTGHYDDPQNLSVRYFTFSQAPLNFDACPRGTPGVDQRIRDTMEGRLESFDEDTYGPGS